MDRDLAQQGLRESATFDRATIAAIQRAAQTGIYDIRGWGAKRRLPHFDDLLFLGASMSRYPLEGYRERCDTDVVLGDRNATFPLHLSTPVTMAGMGFGALSGRAKEALGDSIYEARIYVRGAVESLGADCVAKPMRAEHHQELALLLKQEAAARQKMKTEAEAALGEVRALRTEAVELRRQVYAELER